MVESRLTVPVAALLFEPG